jgi:glycosyltransferase involved in cell wall biosynthesis
VNISAIIPTYKEPDYLDLCIESALKGQDQKNEIVVVVDGFKDINQKVLDKYKYDITPIIFETNYGQQACTNHGVYNSSNEFVLIVNDDNVFPKNWDTILLENYEPRSVVAPNQIEANPSIFKSFIVKNFGSSIKDFDLETFQKEEPKYRTNTIQNDGCTLPIFMKKMDYLSVGGWDESYPSGHVVDWDFFLKLEHNGYKMTRNMKLNFYHFFGISTRSPEEIQKTIEKESQGFGYFRYKWGRNATTNPVTNSKLL